MNKLDKKQMPQFAALCVLSAGVFGYFVMKIVTPSPAAAGTRPRPAAEASQASVTRTALPRQSEAGAGEGGTAATAPDAAPAGDEAGAPAPTPGMRDPFVVGYVETSTQPALPAAPAPAPAKAPPTAKAAGLQVASIRETAPAPPAAQFGLKGFPAPDVVSSLPTAPKKAATPEAPPAPAWTVTGVLQGGAGQMAVLRSGEARRIVRTGDSVDGLYRVVAVTRSAVLLRHGATFYHLTLGAAKPGAAGAVAPALTPARVPAPALTPAPVPAGKPPEDALAPALPAVSMEAGLARMVQGALLMARSYMAPAQLQTDICFASFQAPTPETAQAASDAVLLDLSRDVYGSGPAAAGGARWRCATATTDLAPAPSAGTFPDYLI